MSKNMLENAGFDSSSFSNRALVVSPLGVEERDIGNVETPEGWWTWFWHEPGEWDQPEVKAMRADQYPTRVRSGDQAMLLFTFSRRHDAGFHQTVKVEPGVKLRLSAYAHAWSNHKFDHEDDPGWSEGAGYEHVRWLEVPPLNGDPQNDARGNFTFCVGIDPLGGRDPMGKHVVWGAPAYIYNGYALVPPVEAVAEADTVSVFLRSMTLWAFKHNDAYWDDALLEIVDEPGPGECRGHPRVQYQRVYNVIPEGVGEERAVEIFRDRWRAGRQTVGGSYDDAGVGDLDERVVVLWDILADERQLYLDWYAEHYPGVEVRFAGYGRYEQYLLWQKDPRWKDDAYAGGTCHTIGTKGCFLCINAGAQRWYEIDINATPVTVDQAVGPEGYLDCELRHDAMRQKLGLDIETTHSKAEAIDHLELGDVVFIEVLPKTLQHFVMAVEWNGFDFLVLDPLTNKIDLLHNLYTHGWESFRLISEYEEPNGEPQYPEPVQMLCFQQQWAGEWRDQFIEVVRPDLWKLIGGMGEAYHLKSIHPGVQIVYRHHWDDWGRFVLAADKDKAAREFVAMFRDSLEQHADVIDGIEGLNEWIATNDYETLEHASGWVEAFCAELDRIGMPAWPVTFNVAVGNPQTDVICEEQGIPSQIAYMVDGVRATIAAGGMVGYHAYHGARATSSVRTALRAPFKGYPPGAFAGPLQAALSPRWRGRYPRWPRWQLLRYWLGAVPRALRAKLTGPAYYCTLDGDEARYYSMRALLEWDPVFRAEGLYPRYLMTEGGTIYIAPWGGMPSAYAGWQDPDCFGGDMDHRMTEAIRRHIQSMGLMAEWNAEHGNRARAMTTFGWGMTSEWEDFEWEGEPGRRLAGVLT